MHTITAATTTTGSKGIKGKISGNVLEDVELNQTPLYSSTFSKRKHQHFIKNGSEHQVETFRVGQGDF